MSLHFRHRFAPFESPSWSRIAKPESKLNRTTRDFFREEVDVSELPKNKNRKTDLKIQYQKVLEFSLTVSLVLLIAAFQVARYVSLAPPETRVSEVTIQVTDIPPTEQRIHTPQRPPLPSVPIPTLEESVPEDVTIEPTELNLDLTTVPPPPPPNEEDDDIFGAKYFVPYDEPPAPIGGMAAIHKHLVYPELARRAGIEAMVVVAVLVGVDGTVLKTRILKSSGTQVGFEEAAISAIRQVKWKPAKQRDQAKKVWVSIPVKFQLRDRGPVSLR
ncbi:TonB family protein [candidate division KSB1 bacterium]|nr:TonB family protein [candidate division KSB1 bacterium]NIR71208.1 TonB family protein [candidate division KSB1 bacterium]NIS23312.1 TonB family protein [candidate division KSB1 bacterium]NIT70191.1 TonB family protein [candidate division KSB1 bacterium]NIU23843.1 TonB family protein [candidate division KSB1 bacterium]